MVNQKMQVTLTIIRYRKRFIPFALLAMALFRWPLWRQRGIGFYKLMGCGKNGTFDKRPDWQQWGIMAAHRPEAGPLTLQAPLYLHRLYGGFVARWLAFFGCRTWTLLLQPIEGHGHWDGKQPFGPLPKQSDYQGPIAVLTRATIRPGKLASFWKHVPAVAQKMAAAPGFITSVGIGEVPWIKQATFSLWQSKAAMRQFAYQMQEHAEVVRKTHQERWYSEDMFVRFVVEEEVGGVG
jgi:hypothetical protein